MSKRGFQRRKRTLESRLHARERRGKNAQPLQAFPQGTSPPPATETATPGSGYSVIQDPAQIPRANHCLLETKMPQLLKYQDVSLCTVPVALWKVLPCSSLRKSTKREFCFDCIIIPFQSEICQLLVIASTVYVHTMLYLFIQGTFT